MIPKYYSKAGPEVTSSKGCAGFCQMDRTSCNTFVYNDISRNCYLGKITGSYSFIGKQADADGYLDVGNNFLECQVLIIPFFIDKSLLRLLHRPTKRNNF